MHLWGDIVYCEKENGELIHLTKEQFELLKEIGKVEDDISVMQNVLGNIAISETQKMIILKNIDSFRKMCKEQGINLNDWIQTGTFGKYYPRGFTLEMTDCCNFRCKHCYKEALSSNTSFLPKEILDKMCNDFGGNVQTLNLTGGEPLLYPNFSGLVTELTKQFVINVTTNGSLISKLPIETIKEINNFQISVYGYDEESYFDFTGVQGQFQHVVKGMQLLTEIGVGFTVAICVDKTVCKNIKKYIELLEQYTVKKIIFSTISNLGRGKLLSSVSDEEMKEMARYIIEFSKLNTNAAAFLVEEEETNCMGECLAGKIEYAISEKGSLLYCNVLDKNVFTIGSFEDIYDIIQNGIRAEVFLDKINYYVKSHDCTNHICALLEEKSK